MIWILWAQGCEGDGGFTTLKKYLERAVLLYNYEEPERIKQIQKFKTEVVKETGVSIEARHAQISLMAFHNGRG